MALTVDVLTAPRSGRGNGVIGAVAAKLYPLWLLLLSFVVFDSVRSQRRINARQGEIKLLMDSRLRWQGKEWEMMGTPWMLNTGMMLRLRRVEDNRRQHLWLAADSMDPAEWRDLRRLIVQQPTQE